MRTVKTLEEYGSVSPPTHPSSRFNNYYFSAMFTLSAVLVEVNSNVDVMTFYPKCFRSDSKNKSFLIRNYTFIIMLNNINQFLYLSPQIF